MCLCLSLNSHVSWKLSKCIRFTQTDHCKKLQFVDAFIEMETLGKLDFIFMFTLALITRFLQHHYQNIGNAPDLFRGWQIINVCSSIWVGTMTMPQSFFMLKSHEPEICSDHNFKMPIIVDILKFMIWTNVLVICLHFDSYMIVAGLEILCSSKLSTRKFLYTVKPV